ncbi:Hypothetical protein (Fragment), partial [Durusdinium trenchii]
DEIQFVDERAPGLVLKGLPTYKSFLSALRWSMRSMFEESKLEVISMGRTLVNGKLSVRWCLHLWPKGLMNHALEFFSPTLKGWGFHHNSHEYAAPFVVEGYSTYEFDPWTAEVTRHSVDIKNPPLFLTDLLKQYSTTSEIQAVPYGLPSLRQSLRGGVLAGATAGASHVPREGAEAAATHVPLRASESKSWPLPQSCEDDFECNGGRANFPLQCCELPLLGKFCCKPPDGDPSPDAKDPAWLPLPVPSNDR